MQPNIGFITLAVKDLERSLAFYKDGMEFVSKGVIGDEFTDDITGARGTIAFLELKDNFVVGLYERSNFIKDAAIEDSALIQFGLQC